METKLTLYLDLDGVLADFDTAATTALGMDSYKFDFVHGTEEFWRRLDAIPNFFSSFPPMKDAFLLWDAVKHLRPTILTALPKSNPESVAKQKLAWVWAHLGKAVSVITCYTKDKPSFSGPGCVLVDDRSINKAAWEAAGGTFILHTSAVDTLSRLAYEGVLA